MRKSLLNISHPHTIAQSGQILPLAAILLSLTAIFLLSLSQFVLKTYRATLQSENDFQKSFSDSLSVAYKLNAISVNNQEIAQTLERIFKLYLNGSGHALDLAASTPLWEKVLPVPSPEPVYTALEAALPAAQRQLAAIQSLNDALLIQVPEPVRRYLIRTSVGESLCKIASQPATPQPSGNCKYHLSRSMMGFLHLRYVTGAPAFIKALQQKYGFILINISSEFLLNENAADNNLGNPDDPFARQTISLTHARFCKDIADRNITKHCPRAKTPADFPDNLRQSRDSLSFEPHWSVLVDDK